MIDRFAEKKYDLKYFNSLVQEIDQEFVRANHQIELDSTLPYNDQLQQMFKGYLDDDLFLPLHIRLRKPAKRFGVLLPLSEDHRELQDYYSKFRDLSTKLHQASPKKNFLLQFANEKLAVLRDSRCFLTRYERFNIHEFLFHQTAAKTTFHNKIEDITKLINEILRSIIVLEKTEQVSGKIGAPEDQAKSYEDAQFSEATRLSLVRFMKMLNSKLEFYVRLSLRESILAFNASLRLILAKFERLMNFQNGSFDFSKIGYAEVLDYQNHMKEQRYAHEEPLILVQLVVVDGAITLEPSYADFKQQVKGVEANHPDVRPAHRSLQRDRLSLRTVARTRAAIKAVSGLRVRQRVHRSPARHQRQTHRRPLRDHRLLHEASERIRLHV